MISFDHASGLAWPHFTLLQSRHISQLKSLGRPLSSLILVETARRSDHWLFVYQSETLASFEAILHKTAGAIFVTDWGLVGELPRTAASIYQGLPEPMLDNPMLQVNEQVDRLFVED
ncbi:MAG: hypothetical protein P1V97_14165 [Planctomycetota bacterium]|nr:hypothetical protein [Planctomycetota bacterium]